MTIRRRRGKERQIRRGRIREIDGREKRERILVTRPKKKGMDII